MTMVRHLGSALTDVTYVFDEPTIGLHPHDVARMNELPLALRGKGNTVLVVEHDPDDVVAVADHVVDLGPGPAPRAARWCTPAPSTACGRAAPSRVGTSKRTGPSRPRGPAAPDPPARPASPARQPGPTRPPNG